MIEAHRTKSRSAYARAGMATSKGVGAEEAFLRKKGSGNSDNIRFAVANLRRSAIPTVRSSTKAG